MRTAIFVGSITIADCINPEYFFGYSGLSYGYFGFLFVVFVITDSIDFFTGSSK